MKSLLYIAFSIFFVNAVTGERYVFEFGQDAGIPLTTDQGVIGPLEYHKVVNLSVPPGNRVTYVKVIVNALAPPKVDFDSNYNQVSIRYSILEITVSSFVITTKGVPN